MKKSLNILSYVLNVVLIFILVCMCIGKGTNSGVDKLEQIKQTIIQQERAELPLKVQEYKNVYGITIDSLVITNNVRPYSGYLVTTWEMEETQHCDADQFIANGYKFNSVRTQKTAYVDVPVIFVRGKKIRWVAEWFDTYADID